MGINNYISPTSRPRLPYFILQVVAIKYEDTPIVNEVYVFDFTTKPSQVNYQYKSSSGQYIRPHGFTSDEGGTIPTTISIQGVSGVKPRRQGLHMVDGWTRIKNFRDKVFKLSHTINSEEALNLVFGVESGNTATGDLSKLFGDDIVYAVNWYDYWNDEAYCVDITAFNPVSSHQQGYNVPYTIQCQVLGEPLETARKTTDGLLLSLQSLDWAIDKASEYSGKLNMILNNSELVQIASQIGDGVLGALTVGNSAMQSALEKVPSIISTFKGEAVTGTLNQTVRGYNRFSDSIL